MLSVIIPTCNRIDMLSKCLNLIAPDLTLQNIDYEVIVSDDGKADCAKEIIEKHYNFAKWVKGPQKGPASNRNNGVKHSKGEWLVFIDDDCLPQNNWLSSYAAAIQKYKTKLVFEGRTDADRPRERFDEEAPINLNGDNLWSCNFAIKREFFLQLGGFDESFPFAAMEDIDFHLRAKALTDIIFIPEAFVVHPWRRVKLFASFQKHLKSHKHFANKYGLLSKFDFRWGRCKIFIGSIFTDFRQLMTFSLRGWKAYLQKCLLNFCLIFI
jgi:glycosyltransferase involved in cell wall biosynthesis